MSCIFCEIVKGDIPSYKIWEDEKVFAFLDVHPINPGHVLVIPKQHEPHLDHLDEDTYIAVMKGVRKISRQIAKKIIPPRVGLLVAGWDVPHAHVHVVPMYDYHDLTSKRLLEGKQADPTKEELNEIKKKIIH
jgi:histidine triad (HIT) family protein